MSLAVSKQVKPVLVLDKRVGFEADRKFGVLKSGQTNRYAIIPTQNYSTSNVTFNIQPPAPNIAISRELLFNFKFRITFTGTAGSLNGGTLLYPGLFDAPRAAPLAKVTQSCQATINNASVAQNNYQVVEAFLRSNISDTELKRDFSLMPSMLDTFQNYDDNLVDGYGSANDPLQTYGQNSWQTPRGGFPYTIISNPVVGAGNPATAIVEFETTEPFFLSPFLNATDNEVAFIGVQSLTVQLNFINSLKRIWSHSAGNGQAGTISSLDVTFPQPPQVLANFITPSSLQTVPVSNVYSYNTVDVYPMDFTSIPANNATLTNGASTVTINSQNIQLNYIPKRIFAFVRRSDLTSDFTTTDTFLRINNISINFDNISGLLSGANSQQLYELSKNSGLNMSWTEWSKFVGSVLILDVGRSLMLNDPTEAPSLTTTKQFQMQLSVTNLNTHQAIVPTLYIMTIADGLLTVENNTAILQNTILSREDILNAGSDATNSTVWEKASNWFGGRMVEAASKIKVHRPTGGAAIGGALVGGALVGGASMSKMTLAQRLKK